MKRLRRIQTKLAIVAFFMFAVSLVGAYFYQSSETERAALVLVDKTKDKEHLVTLIMNLTGANLKSYVYDYTYWDEMVSFIETPDSVWAEENIGASLNTYRADAVWIINLSGMPVYSTSTADHTELLSDDQLLKFTSAAAGRSWFEHSFQVFGGRTIEFRTAPIQPSSDDSRTTPPHGYMVAATVWDSAYVSVLETIAGARMEIIPSNSLVRPTRDRDQSSSEGSIVIDVPFPSATGEPAAVLRVRSNSALYDELKEATSNQLLIFIVSAALASIIFFIFLSAWVSEPLRKMSEALRSEEVTPIRKFLNDHTEFGQIARLVKGFFEQRESLDAKERSLSASEAKFRSIFEHAADAALLLKGTFIDCNNKACQLYGASRDEIIGHTPVEYSPERQADGTLSKDAAATHIALALGGTPQQFRWLHQSKTGDLLETEVALNAVAIDGETFLHCTVRDISERLKAEKELRRLATAIEQSTEAILVSDVNGEIEYVNPTFVALTGYSASEVVGRTIGALKSEAQDEASYDAMWSTLLAGKPWHGQFVNCRKDGSTYKEKMTISPMFGADGRITNFVAFKRDISRQVALEQMLAQSQKMEALGTLAGGVAHDFNNLLTVIIGHCEMLDIELGNSSSHREAVQQISIAAERAAALTQQLLGFSRKQVIQAREINLADLVTNTAKMLQRLLGERIELKLTVLDQELFVKADANQIEQVLMNLVVNSRDAMPGGGRLVVDLFSIDVAEDRPLSHTRLSAGSYVVMRVTDTGNGMSNEVLGHVFEPFYTTKDVGKGTGLGLATVHSIVKQYSGAINVISSPGAGTTIDVYLPQVRTSQIEEFHKTQGQHHTGSREKILLLEDEEIVRTLVERILAQLNYDVTSFGDPEEAIAVLQSSHDQYELLITDVVMPKLDGRELAKKVRELYPSIGVLFMSGYTNSIISDEVLRDLNARFMMKPFSKDVIATLVGEILSEQRSKFLARTLSKSAASMI